MFNRSNTNRGGLFKGIAAAYLILLLHLVLIAGLGLVVIFLTGVAHYVFWIMLGGMLLIGFSAYWFFRKLRRQGKTLGEVLRSPSLHGREVEVSLLGGLATMRLGRSNGRQSLPSSPIGQQPRLEDPMSQNIREIQALANLFEKNLITREEFEQAKTRLFEGQA
jgi:hypothetical protein